MKDGVPVVMFDIETDIVSMPQWYWKQVINYKIETEAAIERLKIDLEGQYYDLK